MHNLIDLIMSTEMKAVNAIGHPEPAATKQNNSIPWITNFKYFWINFKYFEWNFQNKKERIELKWIPIRNIYPYRHGECDIQRNYPNSIF